MVERDNVACEARSLPVVGNGGEAASPRKSTFQSGSFGDFLRQLREARGLSQSAVARLTDVPQYSISDLELGKIKEHPSFSILVKLARVYEISLDRLAAATGLTSFDELAERGMLVAGNEGTVELLHELVATINQIEDLGVRRHLLAELIRTATFALSISRDEATGGRQSRQ